MKTTLAMAVALAGLGLAASGANALPAGSVAGIATPDTLIEKTHGWHSSCQRGPAGWHFHSRRDGRVPCAVRPPGVHWYWTFRDGRHGWWHRHERRWH
jgi:hypothetical protein